MTYAEETLQFIIETISIRHASEVFLNRKLDLSAEPGEDTFTASDILSLLPLFTPNSAGSPVERARMTLIAAAQLIPSLARLLGLQAAASEPQELSSHLLDKNLNDSATELKDRLDRHGSDKANKHNYHLLYSQILRRPIDVKGIFEIGLGTNNTDVLSNMGEGGKPGASLRAFRDFCPNAQIFGADIDTRILFEETRIKTFFVDQTNYDSFKELRKAIPNSLDLVIDDGLHSPNANLTTLCFGLSVIKPGGWVVIEDISGSAVPLWQLVGKLLSPRHKATLYRAEDGYLFAVQSASDLPTTS